ncbi:MAG: hypothetical protein P8X55_03135 [Desulfosarcinaceae bacterium]
MKTGGKLLLVALMVVAMLAVAGCSSDKYADAKSLLKDQANAAESYVTGLEKAGNADEVAKVINKYTDDMKGLIPRIKAFREKYPELTSSATAESVPEDVKVEMQRVKEASGKIQSATMNLMKYMLEPKVQQAFQRMGKELGAMSKP